MREIIALSFTSKKACGRLGTQITQNNVINTLLFILNISCDYFSTVGVTINNISLIDLYIIIITNLTYFQVSKLQQQCYNTHKLDLYHSKLQLIRVIFIWFCKL